MDEMERRRDDELACERAAFLHDCKEGNCPEYEAFKAEYSCQLLANDPIQLILLEARRELWGWPKPDAYE